MLCARAVVFASFSVLKCAFTPAPVGSGGDARIRYVNHRPSQRIREAANSSTGEMSCIVLADLLLRKLSGSASAQDHKGLRLRISTEPGSRTYDSRTCQRCKGASTSMTAMWRRFLTTMATTLWSPVYTRRNLHEVFRWLANQQIHHAFLRVAYHR